MGRVKRIWYLSPMLGAKVQASLRIRAVSPVSPEPYHDGMLEDINSLDAAHMHDSSSLL